MASKFFVAAVTGVFAIVIFIHNVFFVITDVRACAFNDGIAIGSDRTGSFASIVVTATGTGGTAFLVGVGSLLCMLAFHKFSNFLEVRHYHAIRLVRHRGHVDVIIVVDVVVGAVVAGVGGTTRALNCVAGSSE